MRYMMLVCVDESVEVSEAEGSPTAWVEEMEARGVRKFGSRLRPVSDATTVQVRGGEVVLSDGPFAETKEQVGGFDLIECGISTRRSRLRPSTRPPSSGRSR